MSRLGTWSALLLLVLCGVILALGLQFTRAVHRRTSAPSVTVTSPEGYAIDLPAGWKRQEPPVPMVDLIYARPEGRGDAFVENINVGIEKLPKALTAEQYYLANAKNMRLAMPLFDEVSAADFRGKVAGKKMVYTWSANNRRMKVVAYFFTREKRGFVITGSATRNSYDRYAALFDRAAASFRWQK